MLDDDDITDDSTRRVNAAFGANGPIAHADWSNCRNASLMLALAERRAPRREYLRALAACARAALPAHSSPAAFEPSLAVVEACANGEADQRAAREAASSAYGFVSRNVAGIEDSVGMAVTEACDLAAGDSFEIYGPDPAHQAAWAWASRDHDPRVRREATLHAFREQQAVLADVVRSVIASLS